MATGTCEGRRQVSGEAYVLGWLQAGLKGRVGLWASV
jgi:hypothetical protein